MKDIHLLPRATPESQGITSQAITRFITEVDQTIEHMHSFMLLRHGSVIAEGWWHPYRADLPHMMFSLSKSFTATAVGLAVHDGLLDVKDPVLDFFPEDAPPRISENLAGLQVKHLLSMSTGHHLDTTERVLLNPNPYKTFLSLTLEHVPGTYFVYNTAASFMLAAIVQKLTGQTLLEYLTPRVLAPVGITGATWDTHPNGVNFGGFGLHLKTEDIARFGQLYLQNGQWQGRQLVPAAWTAQATAWHVSNGSNPASDWEQGYAYHFWRCQPEGVYRGDGAFGQYCVVMPKQDAVIAITSGLGDMQPALSLVWKHLLPAFEPAPLHEHTAAHQEMEKLLSGLAIPLAAGRTDALQESKITRRTYRFPPNPLKLQTLSIDFTTDHLNYGIGENGQSISLHILPFGRSAWQEGEFHLGVGLYRTPVPVSALASGTWSNENTFSLTICLRETPFMITIDLTFTGKRAGLRYRVNYSFGPTELPLITGEHHHD